MISQAIRLTGRRQPESQQQPFPGVCERVSRCGVVVMSISRLGDARELCPPDRYQDDPSTSANIQYY